MVCKEVSPTGADGHEEHAQRTQGLVGNVQSLKPQKFQDSGYLNSFYEMCSAPYTMKPLLGCSSFLSI